MGRRFAVGGRGRAVILTLCRTGPIEMALRRIGSQRYGPDGHRAGTGPGRDKPGDPAGNGVTAGPSPATGTGKDPEPSWLQGQNHPPGQPPPPAVGTLPNAAIRTIQPAESRAANPCGVLVVCAGVTGRPPAIRPAGLPEHRG